MPNKNINNTIELYKKITHTFNLFTVYDKPYWFDFFKAKKHTINQTKKIWVNYFNYNKNTFLSLYINIPFCYKTRCTYCMFNSSLSKGSKQIDDYLNNIEQEIKYLKSAFEHNPFQTLYIGGGTPSILNTKQINRLSKIIFNNFSFKNSIGSKCFEASPPTLTIKKILAIKNNGFDRISIGIQSLNKKVLTNANRIHIPFFKLKKLIDFINVQGFRELNIDLIAGLPEDTIEIFTKNIAKLMDLNIPSITVYFYRYNHDKLFEAERTASNSFINYKVPYSRITLLEKIYTLAITKGYLPPDIHPNSESHVYILNQHLKIINNLTQPIWELNNATLGIGLDAQSYIGHSINYKYINKNNDYNFTRLTYHTQTFSEIDQMREYILQSLENNSFVSLSSFNEMFKKNLLVVFKKEVEILLNLNKIKIENESISMLTKDHDEFSIYIKFFYNQDYLKLLESKL